MLVVAQTIGVLSRDSVVQWFGRTTIKRYVAGSIPGSDKNKKMEKLVVANIEILQCVASGVPGGHCRYQKRVTEPKTYILFVVDQTVGLLSRVTQKSSGLAVQLLIIIIIVYFLSLIF